MNRLNKKSYITPWYITLCNWIEDVFSYKKKVVQDAMFHNVIDVEVSLTNGKKGIVSFEDSFDIDQLEGKYVMSKTGLKSYQEKDVYLGSFAVIYSENEDDWEPVYPDKIISWGEPQYKKKVYPWRLYALKIFGLTYGYESHLAKYCDEKD